MNLQVLDPVAPAPSVAAAGPATREGPAIDGQHVVVTNNGWPSWNALLAEVLPRLDKHGAREVTVVELPMGRAGDAQTLADAASKGGPILIGLANCGSCTVASMQNATKMNASGRVFVAVTDRFVGLASTVAPDVPIIRLPDEIERLQGADLAALVPGLADHVLVAIQGGADQ